MNKKTLLFKDYSEGTPYLIDINSCPLRIRTDYFRRNENIEKKGIELCDHCDGTGNEFMWKYHKCPKCSGTGIKQ